MRDGVIRDALVQRLRRANADSTYRLVEEMSVGLGASRVDVGLINGHLSGYEIKSDSDNLSRLPGQITNYGRCLEYAVVVIGAKHAGKVEETLPKWWGIWIAEVATIDDVRFRILRRGTRNPDIDPFYMVQLLWRSEVLELLEEHGLDHGMRSATRWAMWDRAAEGIPVRQLAPAVRERLKHRPEREVA